nr:NAD(P)/FAD-dependent oxidoreductase [Paracoccus saliphilus]
MAYDTIIIGGSHAGMSAALQLLRARRQVLVIDAGAPRNRFSDRAHSVLGADGMDRATLMAESRRQIERYPTLTWVEGSAVDVQGVLDDFRVTTDDCATHRGRRLLFATGVVDSLPDVEGLAERWGTGVFHCPYCHAYELDQGELAVLAIGARSLEQARLLNDWGRVTLLTNQALTIDRASRQEMEDRRIAIEETPVVRVTDQATVELTDGRRLAFAGIFTSCGTAPASPLARQLGCQLSELPTEQYVVTTDCKETTVKGAYACGDTALAHHSITLALADGAFAGSQIHHSLVEAPLSAGTH